VQKFSIFRPPAPHGRGLQSARFGDAQHVPDVGVAKPQRICQDRIEDGGEFARGRRYDAQHFRRSGPLLQRLGEVIGALAQFVQ
jgi:hypothetical protein